MSEIDAHGEAVAQTTDRDAGTPNALHLSNQICFAVYSAAHAFNRIYKPLLDRIGLTYPQYLVLLLLWEQDGQTMKTLGSASTSIPAP